MAARTRRNPEKGLGHLRVNFTPDAYMGPGRAELLQGIAETHSIAAAGRRMGMSYKRAWGLVQALNEGFGSPLVSTTRGGSSQGGAELTELGQDVLNTYQRMLDKTEAAIAADLEALARRLSPKS